MEKGRQKHLRSRLDGKIAPATSWTRCEQQCCHAQRALKVYLHFRSSSSTNSSLVLKVPIRLWLSLRLNYQSTEYIYFKRTERAIFAVPGGLLEQ